MDLQEVSEQEFKNMSHMYCMGNSYIIAIENYSKTRTCEIWYVH